MLRDIPRARAVKRAISGRPRNKLSSSDHIERPMRPISYNKVRTTSWGTMVEILETLHATLGIAATVRLAGTLVAARTFKERDQSLLLLSMAGKWRMRQDNIREGMASTRRTVRTFGSGYLERPAYALPTLRTMTKRECEKPRGRSRPPAKRILRTGMRRCVLRRLNAS